MSPEWIDYELLIWLCQLYLKAIKYGKEIWISPFQATLAELDDGILSGDQPHTRESKNEYKLLIPLRISIKKTKCILNALFLCCQTCSSDLDLTRNPHNLKANFLSSFLMSFDSSHKFPI